MCSVAQSVCSVAQEGCFFTTLVPAMRVYFQIASRNKRHLIREIDELELTRAPQLTCIKVQNGAKRRCSVPLIMPVRRGEKTTITPPITIPGSIFGQAVGSPYGGFWSKMEVSPPRSPMLLSNPTNPGIQHLRLDSIREMDTDAEVPVLQRVCASWLHEGWGDAALVVFDDHLGSSITVSETPRRVTVEDPVVPTMVNADAVSWARGFADAHNLERHVFTLTLRNRLTTTVEAFVNKTSGEIERVAVVQPQFSSLNLRSGMCLPSALKIFDGLEGHLRNLQELKNKMRLDSTIGYSPSAEVVIGKAFLRLKLGLSNTADHGCARDPQAVWQEVSVFFKDMSTLAKDLTLTYTSSELSITNTSLDLQHRLCAWESVV